MNNLIVLLYLTISVSYTSGEPLSIAVVQQSILSGVKLIAGKDTSCMEVS